MTFSCLCHSIESFFLLVTNQTYPQTFFMPPANDPDASIRKLREKLDPAASSLCRDISSYLSEIDLAECDPQTISDLEKLKAEAQAFQAGIESWFRVGVEKENQADRIRKSRHDARNALNHLFGLVQLLQMTPPSPAFVDWLQQVAAQLEQCLSLVASTANSEPDSNSSEIFTTEAACENATAAGSILVVDDDGENREILSRLLTPCGFSIEEATNGKEAIRLLEEHDFDAVLLDIEMPEMNGFEVLETLRERGTLRHTPVIVVTGLQEEQDAVRCIEIGAEDFLSRPIRPALLMARLNASLEKKRLREKVFEQHFTPELARELARNPDPMKMQAREAEVSVLFCDIRGFSIISERLGPTQTIDWLSGVMGEFSSIVIEHGGVLVDYTGDELMALWGAPNEQPNHAALACQAALDILGALPGLNETWMPLVGGETQVGIGVNTGTSLVGNVGTHRKFKYGPLGTTVNLASRVQGATKYLKTSLLITGDTAEQLPDSFSSRRLCQVRVQNIQKPIHLHELQPPQADIEWSEVARAYEEALDCFEAKNFRKASSILGDALLVAPNDGPSLQLMSRVVEAMLNDGAHFSPTWTLPGK